MVPDSMFDPLTLTELRALRDIFRRARNREVRESPEWNELKQLTMDTTRQIGARLIAGKL